MTRTIAAAALCTVLSQAGSASAFHCENRLVDEGDPAARVRSLCGEPVDVSRRVESRAVTVHRRLPDGSFVSDTAMVSVEVEIWVYDFGPRRFMRELSFEEGRLVRIRTLGYGTRRDARPPSD